MPRAYRKRLVSRLQSELVERRLAGFDPQRRAPFDVADQIAQTNRRMQRAGDVHVIVPSADSLSQSIEAFANPNDVGEQFGAENLVAKKRLTMFGQEDDVNMNLG